MAEKLDVAVLAGGCFWCMETIFKQIKGIEKVETGYGGGNVKNLPMKRSVQVKRVMLKQ